MSRASKSHESGAIPQPRPPRDDPAGAPRSGRVTVERAKGILMFRHGVNSHQAFAILIRRAHMLDTDVTLLAERLIDDALREGLVPHTSPTEVRWLAAAAEAYRAVIRLQRPDEILNRVLDIAVRTADADFGLIAAPRNERPQVLRVLAAHGLRGRHRSASLPMREPWTTVVTTGAPISWCGRLDPASASAETSATLAPFTVPSGEPGALLVARPRSAESSWPAPDLTPLLTAYARQVSLGLALEGTEDPTRISSGRN